MLVRAPVGPVARKTEIFFPSTTMSSGRLAAPGFTNSTWMSFPPSWPQARDVITTVCDCAVPPAGAFPIGSVPLMFACARRW